MSLNCVAGIVNNCQNVNMYSTIIITSPRTHVERRISSTCLKQNDSHLSLSLRSDLCKMVAYFQSGIGETIADTIGTVFHMPKLPTLPPLPVLPSTPGEAAPPTDSPAVTKFVGGGPAGMAGSTLESIGTTMKSTVEAAAKTITQAYQVRLPRYLTNSASDGSQPDIKFYLGKPVKVATGTFSTTDTAGIFPNFGVFTPLVTNPIWYNKLVGVHAIRATTVVTLQVNATRFQSGRYMLYFLPYGGANLLEPASTDAFLKMKYYTATQVSQLMHVELDLSRDTEVTLRIPYTNFASATPIVKASATNFTIQTPGRFSIYPYMRLQAGAASSTCNYTLWVHYEDVELFGNMAPQSGLDDRGFTAKAVKGIKDVVGMEMYNPGPVETAANKVRLAAESGSKIPLLSSIAAPLSWIADVVGGTASAFGWSKPLLITNTNIVHNEMFAKMPNCDAHDEAVAMSITQGNRVAVLPGFGGTDQDELSIDFLKRVPAFYNSYDWTPAAVAGTQIFKFGLNPANFVNSYTVDGNVTLSMPPVSWVAQYFSIYKGGLRFKIKIVKTEFHSGRLIFGFFPCDTAIDSTGAEATYANLDYIQKTIIDVREDVEWDITVPWVSTTPYKFTNPNDVFGFLCCYVQTPLLAPEGVPSTAKILVEVCGADDLQFQIPKKCTLVPMAPKLIKAAPQSGLDDLDTGMIGETTQVSDGINDAAVCVGENVTSFRQLMKRPQPMIPYSNSKLLVFYPEMITPVIVNDTVMDNSQVAPDLITTLGCMFALRRGSIRIKLLPHNVTNITDIDTLMSWTLHKLNPWSSERDAVRVVKSSLSSATASGATQVVDWSRNGAFCHNLTRWGNSFTIPFYANTHSVPTIESYATSSTVGSILFSPGSNGQPTSQVRVFCSSVGNMNLSVMRYAGDDMNFGLFTGVPPLYDYTL